MNTEDMDFDLIVVGAGAMGSATAYWAQKQGLNVLLLEQNELLHTQGSSHGESRIIRLSYSEPYFIQMMKRSYELWTELEKEGSRQLVFRTGGMDFGRETNPGLKKVMESHRKAGLDNEILNSKELSAHFPQFKVDEDYLGIYQAQSGIVNPHLTLRILHTLFQKKGGKIKAKTPVKNIQKRAGGFSVENSKGTFTASHLVLTPGSWINSLLSPFNLCARVSIWGLTYSFWKGVSPKIDLRSMPVFIHWDQEIHYGFPEFEKEGHVKVAAHISPTIPEINPEETYRIPFGNQLESTSNFITKRLSGFASTPVNPTNCRYTMTDDENFILGQLPDYDGAFIASGFSGHGFKFTPLIGKILVDLIQTGNSEFDLSYFNPKKFIISKN